MEAARSPLTFIVAVSRNGVIGKNGGLPWDLPEDRAFFRDQTWGHAVIMGHRTWNERGEPLPGRRNIVVSRSGAVSGKPEERDVVGTVEDAIAHARTTDAEPFVVGGAEIFRLAFPYATRLLITELTFDAEGDTFMPPYDKSEWRATSRRAGDRATYVTYDRVST